MLTNARLPTGLFSRIHLAEEVHAHTWKDPEKYQIQIVNQANQKWLAKGNPEEMPHKSNSNCNEVTKKLWVYTYVYLYILYSFFLLINFTCFTIFCLCGDRDRKKEKREKNSLFCKVEGIGPLSLTPGWVATIWFCLSFFFFQVSFSFFFFFIYFY